ncbi:hypothetical protein HanPI659440_Chr15g0602501 [Helianthus annuus]|nr:hypothetical protein HanPI659440_Chr15g0602501 [Helianthus annuus]
MKEDALGNGLHTTRKVVRAQKAVKRFAYLEILQERSSCKRD